MVPATACTRPNPAFDGIASETGTASSESESESGSGSEAESEASDASESEAETGEAPMDLGGPQPDVCGDGIVGPEEDCDDGNQDPSDGCLSDCRIPESCADILDHAPGSATGEYQVDPEGSGEPWQVWCEMDFDGGGWTGIRVEDTCNGHLWSEVVAQAPAAEADIDENCRPFAMLPNGGAFSYYWDIHFSPGFEAFYLFNYSLKAIGTPELSFAQTAWPTANGQGGGALSLGCAEDPGPMTTWVDEGGQLDALTDQQVVNYPAFNDVFELGLSSDTLRIAWGEAGTELEGLYPWWSGVIYLR